MKTAYDLAAGQLRRMQDELLSRARHPSHWWQMGRDPEYARRFRAAEKALAELERLTDELFLVEIGT